MTQSVSVQVGFNPDEAVKRVAEAAVQGKLVLFIGAGMSRNAGLPVWKDLLDPAAQRLGGWEAWSQSSLPSLAEAFEQAENRRGLLDLVIEPLQQAREPSRVHHLLPKLRPKQIFTTNYDRLLESTFPQAKCVASPGNAAQVRNDQLAIFYVHGHIDHLGDDIDGLIITESDYRSVAKTKRAFLERLKPHWQDSLILFIGYGAGDEDLKAQAHAVREIFGTAHAPRHLAVDVADRANEALLRVQWSPLQAHVVLGRDLLGVSAGERLERWLRRCGEAIDKAAVDAENALRQRELGRTGIVADVSATVEQRLEPTWVFQPPSQLPPDLPDFTGREQLIAKLEARLCSDNPDETGIWGVHGMGGVGKSALAERIANRLRRSKAFPDGYLWIKVGERSLAEVLVECWYAIGGPDRCAEGMSLDMLQTTLRRVWRDRRMLIVLDNCDRAERIPDLLLAFNGHKLLITTRVTSERVGWFPVDCLDRHDALTMLRAICPRLDNVPDDDLATLAIERLGGLPLALRLAGTWLQYSARRSVAEYLELLQEEGLKLLNRKQTAPGFDSVRASDIRACFALSVNALNAMELTTFKLLAMTGHDLPINVAHDWLHRAMPAWTKRDRDDAIDSLIAAALLESGTNQRLKMHALLRDHGRELKKIEPIVGIASGAFAEMLLNTVKTIPPDRSGLPWACSEAALIDAAIQNAWTEGATHAALILLQMVAGTTWASHGPLLPIRRLATLMLNEPDRLDDKQRLVALEIRGDVCLRLNAEAMQDLVAARNLAIKLAQDEQVVRCVYLLRNLLLPKEWMQTIRSVVRMARAKNFRLSDVQQMTGKIQTSAGRSPSGLARLGTEWAFSSGANSDFICMINLHEIVSCHNGVLTSEKIALCTQLSDWAAQRHFPSLHASISITKAEHCARTGDLSSAMVELERLRCARVMDHSVAIKPNVLFALACLSAQRGDSLSLHEAQQLLAQITSNSKNNNRRDGLRLALLAFEVDLRLGGFSSQNRQQERLNELMEQAEAWLDIASLLWVALLKAGTLWLRRKIEPTHAGHAQTILARVNATLNQLPSIDRLHIDRATEWLSTIGLKPSTFIEIAQAQPYDLRPAWWIATDSLPRRITLTDGTPMVLFTPGCYAIRRTSLSDPDTAERPAHIPLGVWDAWLALARQLPPPTVWLPGFYMDIHPVTWHQYLAYCKTTNTTPTIDPPEPDFGNRPVTGLTHEEATAYADWAGKRLPIADEWRAALCGETGRRYPWGDEIGEVNIDAVAQIQLPDMSVHPLTTFDEVRFAELLQGSLSLSISGKITVANAVPTLSQFQIDELFKVFEDELEEFEKLQSTEGDVIKRLGHTNMAEQLFASGVAPRDVMSIQGDATPEGVRDLVGCVREWITESVEPQHNKNETDRSKNFRLMGLLPDQRLLNNFNGMSSMENVVLAQQPADATIGFRCVIPLIDSMELPPEVKKIYGAYASSK